MRVLIVEDETAASENLTDMLQELEPDIEILGVQESVQQTVRWLSSHSLPDLIFMDIHLSDASAFTIFEQIQVTVPIIFTTAYDQYALDAFQVNSVDYLLKPIKMRDLQRALDKYHRFSREDVADYLRRMLRLNPNTQNFQSRLLVTQNDHLLPVDVRDIACIHSTGKVINIYLMNGKSYVYNHSLDQIMDTLDPNMFIRANKQFIVSREAIREMVIWFDSRLLVKLPFEGPEPLYVSKNKAAEFKKWFTQG